MGQAIDDPRNVHADFDPLFEEVRLVEEASGLDLVAIETDKDIAGSGFFAAGATTLIPERALLAQFGRETEIEPTFAFGLVTVGSSFLVGTGERQAIINESKLTGAEQARTLVVVRQMSDNLGVTVSGFGDQGASFAIAVLHIAGDVVGEEAVMVELAL